MEYVRWAPTYRTIADEFGFSLDRERRAAERLRSLLPKGDAGAPLRALGSKLAGREVIVVGCGPNGGAPPVWTRPQADRLSALIAADGATERCLAAGLVPDVITTDLDGPVPAEVLASSRGSAVLVHAHADNVAQLDRWVPDFHGEVFGSWAGPPDERLVNVGGFTDGDRAAFLADHVGASRILLWGFDFLDVSEEPAERRPAKRRKLGWAERLLVLLAREGRTPIFWWARDGSVLPYPGIGPATQ